MGQATEPTDRVFSPKSKAVESDPQRLRANARRPMRDVGRLDGAQIAPLRDRARIQIDWLSARIGTVRAWVTSAVHNFTLPRKRTADTGKRGRETEYPYASIGLAAAIETLLGLILSL